MLKYKIDSPVCFIWRFAAPSFYAGMIADCDVTPQSNATVNLLSKKIILYLAYSFSHGKFDEQAEHVKSVRAFRFLIVIVLPCTVMPVSFLSWLAARQNNWWQTIRFRQRQK